MYTYLFYDVCAILALATLVLALIVRKLTKGRNNVVFLVLCCSMLVSAVLDIATEVLDNMQPLTDYYLLLREILTTIFFFFHNLSSPLYFLYISSATGGWHKIKSRSVLFYVWIVPLASVYLLLITNPITHYFFYYDSERVYRHGILFTYMYVVALYYIVAGIVMIITNRRGLSRVKFWALILFLPINALSIFVQVLYPQYRIESFSAAMLAIIVAISVHRPEEMMDYVVGMQSYNAFLSATKTNFSVNISSCYLFIRLDNFEHLKSNVGFENYMKLLRHSADKIESICRIMTNGFEAYYLDRGIYAIVAEMDKYDQLLDAGRTIYAYLQEPVKIGNMEVMSDARICIVKCPEDIGNEISLLNFASTFYNKLPEDNHVIALSQVSGTRDFRIRNDMETIISRGISERNFEMYYQPIYSVKEGRFASAEALIRLKDPTFGMISPAIFIPEAEESGAIHDIGDYVTEEVCRFIGSDNFRMLNQEYIEINLSVAQLIEMNLCDKIKSCMDKYNVNPEQINLEITETAADYDPVISDKNIRELRRAGLTFSLDDYGTGYSNIARVASLPLDIVKLDKSLVDDMDTPLMWIVIKNTVAMLKKMNKKILVEGIEDKRSLDKFIEIGCDYIQGYYFSKPLPEEEYIEFIKHKNGLV